MKGSPCDKVQKLAMEFLGREIDRTELRLYPYLLDFIMKEVQILDLARLREKEVAIIASLQSEGHIDNSDYKIVMSKEFYDYMNEVLWEDYVCGDD